MGDRLGRWQDRSSYNDASILVEEVVVLGLGFLVDLEALVVLVVPAFLLVHLVLAYLLARVILLHLGGLEVLLVQVHRELVGEVELHMVLGQVVVGERQLPHMGLVQVGVMELLVGQHKHKVEVEEERMSTSLIYG